MRFKRDLVHDRVNADGAAFREHGSATEHKEREGG
jgi:hypothetical protein